MSFDSKDICVRTLELESSQRWGLNSRPRDTEPILLTMTPCCPHVLWSARDSLVRMSVRTESLYLTVGP